MMTMQLAKFRALAYVDRGELHNAVASMLSDLEKGDPEMSLKARGAFGHALAMDGLGKAIRGDAVAVRKWIEGFYG
jgi:hypothetical protein